jgi:acyl-coenzyme A synthetase/AMP-(fatty) acid ligase
VQPDETAGASLSPRGPDETITRGKRGCKTVSELLEEAVALARRLPDGHYAINLHTNRYDYLLGFCAALMAGHTTLMPPNRQPQTLADLEQLYPGSYRIGDADAPLESGPEVGSGDVSMSAAAPDAQQTAIIAFTSGSTGKPAPTAKSWRTLCAGNRNNFASLLNGIGGTANLVATVPCQHMWGFETAVLLPLLSPVTINDRSPLYPLDIAKALAEIPQPRVLVSSPLHLRALMRSGVAVSALARILTATAPMDAAEAQDLESYFDTEVLDAFGCSESGVFATRRTARRSDWTLTPPFTLESRETGTLVCAAHLAEAVMLPDRLELIDEKTFKWIGRNQDIVNIAGKRGSLADLNGRLASIEGVLDGVVFQPEGAQRLAAMVVAPGLEARDVLRALKSQIDPAFLPRPVYMVPQLPRQETGKLSQSATLELFNTVQARQRSEGKPTSQAE